MVISFNDTTIAFKDTGHKSYNLAKASELGLNIPRYVCITPTDCINNTINPETFKRLKRILQSNFSEGTLFAVRPSINLYDENLFRQFKSYMNVPLNRLDEYIDDCLASINTKRVQSYIKRHNSIRKLQINVIVQEMMSQKLCGVMFTSNPLEKVISENMVVVGDGDCNEIFEDRTKFNTYYYNTSDSKSYWIINDDEHLLSGDVLRNIYSILEKVKKFYSKPLRLDFSIKNGIVYILQIDELQSFSLDNIITLCNADIMMSYKKQDFPLNNSFIKDCYSNIFSNLIFHLTNSKELAIKNKKIFDDVITLYNGQLYYNINNLYEVFSLIPFSHETENINDELSITDKIINTLNMIKALFTSTHKLENAQNSFEQVEQIFNKCYSDGLSDIQLKSLYRVILNKTIEKWDISIINSAYCYLNENTFKKNTIKKSQGMVLDIHTEDGVAGVVQQQILIALSKNDIPKEICLKFYEYIQTIFLDMGTNLVDLNYIEKQEDIYYLTVNEIFNERLHSYKDVVKQRKSLYEFYSRLPKYNQISFDGKVTNKRIVKYETIV